MEIDTLAEKPDNDNISRVLNRLNENNNALVFSRVSDTPEAIQALFDFFNNRQGGTRISSVGELDFDRHSEFVKNHPYRYWFTIGRHDALLGSLYIRFDNTLSLQMVDFADEAYEKILQITMQIIAPLDAIPSVRPPHFFINLAPDNKLAAEKLIELGMRQVQHTYAT